MNRNETRTLWLSVGAALLAVLLLYSHAEEKEQQLQSKFGVEEGVVVAKENIPQMQTIVDSMLEIVKKPKEYIEPGAVTNPELAIGQVAAAPIKKGEQVIDTKLLQPGPFTGISLQVAPGKRAVAIPVDESRAVSKLLKPGDRVDIVAALDVGKGTSQRREVKTLMQDVVILATGVNVINSIPRVLSDNSKTIDSLAGDTKFATITVEVDPKEAQDLILILSTSPGSIFLTARNPNDRLRSPLATASLEGLVSGRSTEVTIEQPRLPASVPQAPVRPQPTTLPKKKNGPFIDL